MAEMKNESIVSYKHIAEVLDKEIEYCKDHPLSSGKGRLWENGFAAGLEQAKTLIEKVRFFIGVDEAHGNDEGIKTEGYWLNGVYTITKVSRLTQDAADVGTEWVCSKCGTTNMLDVPICQACFHPRG